MILYERSWLFEVVNSKTEKILKSFTLIIPPEDITITEKQRVSITKTFGDVFIDDYGPDNPEITLSGITGTSRVFPTFSTKGNASGFASINRQLSNANATEGYDGRSAFFKFRDEIVRYKEKQIENRELRVYDLYDRQAYKCTLLDFKLRRQASRPFYYTYNISLFVEKDLLKKRTKNLPKPIIVREDPVLILNEIDSTLSEMEEKASLATQLHDAFLTVQARSTQIRSRLTRAATQALYVVNTPLQLSNQIIGDVAGLITFARSAYDSFYFTLSEYAGFCRSAMNVLRRALQLWGVAVADNTQQGATTEIPVLGETENPTVAYSGFSVYTVRGNDTLQTIAQRELGDSELWPVIALINGVPNNVALSDVEVLYLPSDSSETREKDLYIISEDTVRSAYGADIALDSAGAIVVDESGDIASIDGIANVIQAVNIRLSTPLGTMIKNTAYGLAVTPGGTPAASLSYLEMALITTLTQDPRIQNVSNVDIRNVQSEGLLEVSLDLELVGEDSTVPITVEI